MITSYNKKFTKDNLHAKTTMLLPYTELIIQKSSYW